MITIATIIGARPQFIKAATVSRAIFDHNRTCNNDDRIDEAIIHTGQHYDENMSKVFFDELQIPKPAFNLGIGSDSQGKQTGRMLSEIEGVLALEKPDLVLTYGDTNSTLAGTLAAAKLGILTAHVEAGLRSYNRSMPEEINRLVADELSNILFCPTKTAVKNLQKEGIGLNGSSPSRISPDTQLVFQVGDVMYDSILFNKKLAEKRSHILADLNVSERSYSLATVHRAENTDDKDRLANILSALSEIARSGVEVILPLHPRTRKKIQDFGLDKDFDFLPEAKRTFSPEGTILTPIAAGGSAYRALSLLPPVGYLDMLQLEGNAQAILTDSGGMQKEAFLLGVPCVTLRNETEWVETVSGGWNRLTGSDREKIKEAVSTVNNWNRVSSPFGNQDNPPDENPYGNGAAAEKIVSILARLFLEGHVSQDRQK
jgi:UDP-GlcNAc3NAcA epimerase